MGNLMKWVRAARGPAVFLGLLGACGAAMAEPISSILYAIGTAVGASAATAAAVGGLIVSAAVSFVSSAYASSQAKKKARQAAARKFAEDVANLKDRTATLLQSDSPWPTIYGAPARVGGSVAAVLSSGLGDEYKHIVIVFAAHESEAIDEIFIDGESVGSIDEGGWADGEKFQLKAEYAGDLSAGPAVNVQFHTSPGGVDTADQFLKGSVDRTFPGLNLWTDEHRLSGYTYAVITLNLFLERFQGGLPEITARIRGKKVYDPRTGLTKFSRNPALCLTDFLRSEVGYQAAQEQVDEAALIAAANACDEIVYSAGDALNYGNSNARYVCDGMFRSDQDRESTRQQIEESMAGFSLESGGVWRIQAGAWSTPVLALTDEDMLAPIVVGQTCNATNARYNGARGTYVNAAGNGISEDFTPYQNSVFRASDEKDKWYDMALTFTSSHMRCQQLARVYVEQSRGGFVLQIQPKMKAWHLQPGDRIVLSSALYGFANKTFRVQDWTYSARAPLALVVIEDIPAFYDLADEVLIDPAPNTNLPSPFLAPEAPMDVTVTSGQDLMVQQGPVRIVRAQVKWAAWSDAGAARGGAVRVQWRLKQANEEWQTTDLPGTATETFLLGLQVGGIYQVRLRFQTAYASSSWSIVEHGITGKTDAPSSVDGLTVTIESDGVYARWNRPAGLDLIDWNLTELRIGDEFTTAVDVWSGKAEQANLGWLKAGLVKVWARHGDTTDRWSTPVSNLIEILVPVQPVVTGEAFRDQVELSWPPCGTSLPIRGYDVRVGASFAAAQALGTVDALGYKYTQTVPGTYIYWVSPVDMAGNRGAPGFKQLVTLPGIQESLDELHEGLDDIVADLGQAKQDITKEVQDRTAADQAEATARSNAVAAEATARANALAAEQTARTNAITTQANRITQEITDRGAAITAEQTARGNAISAEQTARANALAAEVTARNAAIAVETANRTNALTAEATARTNAITTAVSAETAARNQAISAEATLRTNADQAEVTARTNAILAESQSREAAIASEASARSTADQAEVTARQNLATQLQNADQVLTSAIQNEATIRSSADAAEVSQRESLGITLMGRADVAATLSRVVGPSLRASFAAAAVVAVWELPTPPTSGWLYDEQQARITSDSAEVSARESLAAQMRGTYAGTDLAQVTSGLIYTERQARVTADQAEVTARQALETTVTNNKSTTDAAIVSEQNARTTADSALGTRVDTLTTTVNTDRTNANTAITSEQTARTNADSALGTRIDTLTTTVNNNQTTGSAAIVGEASARAAADAAEAAQRQSLATSITGMPNPADQLGAVVGESLTLDFGGTAYNVWQKPAVDTLSSGLIFEERQARVTADSAEVTARQALEAVVNTNKGSAEAAMTAEQTARANADAAEVTAREAFQTQMRGTYAGTDLAQVSTGLIAAEKTARTTADTAIVGTVTALQTTVTNNKSAADAAILAEQTARADADAAEVTARQALQTTVTSNKTTTDAAIVAEQNARSTADGALGTRIDGVIATATTDRTNASTAMTTEQTARASADTALGTRIDTLTTTVITDRGAASTAITNEQTARASADTALGGRIDTLTSTVSDNKTTAQAAVNDEAATRATADTAEAIQRASLGVVLTGAPAPSNTLAGVVGPSLKVSMTGGSLGVWEPMALDVLSSGLIFDERRARITADSAEVTARQALATTVTNNKTTTDAAIAAEQTARSNADAAEVTARESLATQMRGTATGTDVATVTSGLLFSEKTARTTADTAIANSVTALSTTVTNNKTTTDAAILAEQTTRASADTANATEIAAVKATVTGNKTSTDAAINSEASARATADAAEATRREALSASVMGMPNPAITLDTVEGQSLDLDFGVANYQAWFKPSYETLSSGLLYEERQSRITADSAEVSARQLLEAKVTSNKAETDAAIVNEQTVRSTADTANANNINSLSAVVNSTTDGLPSRASNTALTALSTRVTNAEGLITSQGSAITNLNSSLSTTNTNVTAAQSAADAANTLAGGKGKVMVQSATPAAADQLAQNLWIDTTNNANTPKRWTGSAWVGATDKVATDAAAAALAALATAATKADATAVNSLATRVTNAEGQIASQGDSLTSLNSSLELSRGDSAASLTADEAMADANAWRSHYNTSLAANFVTTTTGKVSTTVCRSNAGGGSFWNYSKSKVVVDPARTYRISAWIRRAGANGPSYFTWWRNTLGTYGNVGINQSSLPDNTWAQITVQLTGAGLGDTSVSPGFALNHTGGTAGYCEIQGFRFEDITDSLRITNAETTKADASALNALTTRVSNAEGLITSQGSSITSLNSSLSTTNTNVTAAQTAATNAATLAGAKGKVMVQSTAPAAADQLAQNLWIDTTNNANTPKRWTGSAWTAVSDKVATDAAAAAAAAQTTANTKADASAVNSLTTRVTNAEGTITSQASSLSSLNTTVGQNTASISNTSSALATLTGQVKATWRLNVDANGKTSGIILDNNGQTSSLVMLVDKFAIATSGAGGAVKYPFVVGTVAGSTTIGIDGNMVVDGTIQGRALVAESVTADKIKGKSITADQIAAGAITADLINVGMGPNMVPDSGMIAGFSGTKVHTSDAVPTGWTPGQTFAGSAQFVMNYPDDNNWHLPGQTACGIFQPNEINTSVQDKSQFQQAFSPRFPIIPGQRYEFSVYTGAHRCFAWVIVEFYDINGNTLAQFQSTDTNGDKKGGKLLSDWKRLGAFVTAPANAATAIIAVRKAPTQAGTVDKNSWLFYTMPMFAPAGVSQTVFSAYSHSGQGTQISGYGIDTPALSAMSANVGLLRTATWGARTEIESNQVRVYDSNNVLRVRMGVW